MFYSQVILSKKGPLGKVWQAAHWGDKKLGRPAIFATNIEETVDHIVDPAAPLALRVSSHLLWGVVRIYSRKVQYLLDDCQQAVTKVASVHRQTPKKSGATIDLPARGPKSQLNVSHFGEFSAADDIGVAVDFEIPFDVEQETTEEDWVPAELPDEAPLIPEPVQKPKPARVDEDDNWGNVEFNPFDDDDEEQNEKDAKDKDTDNSTVSDLEKPRQKPADESVASLTVGNDTSNEVSGINVSTGLGNEDEEQNAMMFDNDDMVFDDNNSAQAVDVSGGNSPGAAIDFGNSPVRGVSPSASEKSDKEAPKNKRRKANEDSKRKKKKRKVLVDDDATGLTTQQMKDMLNDTSAIAPPSVHPTKMGLSNRKKSFVNTLSIDELLLRPSFGDDGFLAPQLVQFWARNTATVAGKPFAYELREEEDVENPANEDSNDETGMARNGDNDVPTEVDNEPSLASDEDPPPVDYNNDDAIPFDEDQPAMEIDVPMAEDFAERSLPSDSSVFSLGATNDLDDMQLDEPLTSAKWHKNTVKVLDVLKHNLKDKDQVSFQELSKSTSRRTAVGFFFEVLQLKTLDYIEVNQEESYGDIKISEGVKFAESAPAEA